MSADSDQAGPSGGPAPGPPLPIPSADSLLIGDGFVGPAAPLYPRREASPAAPGTREQERLRGREGSGRRVVYPRKAKAKLGGSSMRRAAVILAGVIALTIGCESAAAATVTVTIGAGGQLRFSPADATIHVGDTVRWTWASSFHSTTSGSPPGTPNGKWDSGVQNQPFTFQQRFTATGTFHYFCRIHYAEGMVGAVTVVSSPPRLWVSNGKANSTTLFAANAAGNVPPLAVLHGASTGLSDPFGLTLDAGGRLRVANATANSLSLFAAGSLGNVAPLSEVTGPETGLATPQATTLDSRGDVFTADHASNSLTEHSPGATGNAKPLAIISGAATELNGPSGISSDTAGHTFVANASSNSVTEYTRGASGNIAPIATIQGAATGLNSPAGVSVAPGNKLVVANRGSNSITEYAAGASGNVAPSATIAGAATGLRGPEGIAVDRAGNLVVPNALGNTVTEYSPGVSGDIAPFAQLVGTRTLLKSPVFIALVTPSVATGAASTITSSAARLHGILNPNAADTQYSFQYGKSESYGLSTGSVDAGAGASPVPIASAVTSLAAHTAYHFRLVATSDAGTRYGSDAMFTTS